MSHHVYQLCTKFCNKWTTSDRLTLKKLQNTDGPKFADPSMAAVSPYFKGSMVRIVLYEIYLRILAYLI